MMSAMIVWAFFFFDLNPSTFVAPVPPMFRSEDYLERRECEAAAILKSEIPGSVIVTLGNDSWLACRRVLASR